MACFEKIVDNGAGATDYLLSRGTWNNPYALRMPDTEGCPECDGQLSGSDFEPQSVACNVTF